MFKPKEVLAGFLEAGGDGGGGGSGSGRSSWQQVVKCEAVGSLVVI